MFVMDGSNLDFRKERQTFVFSPTVEHWTEKLWKEAVVA
jgi:hypothetical protein